MPFSYPISSLLGCCLGVACSLSGNAATLHYTHSVAATSSGFTIQIESQTETVSYQWVAPPVGNHSIGTVRITDSINGASPQGQIVLSPATDWIGPSEALQSVTYQTAGTPTAILSFTGPLGLTHLTLKPLVDAGFAGIKISADRATVKDIRFGSLPSALNAEQISVPYYSQAVNYVESLDLFENSYFDAFDSHASTITTAPGPETFYAVNENGVANSLNDVWKVSVSKDIVNVLPYPEHVASPYRSQLAGRLVLDISTTPFETIAAQMNNLGDYGVGHCVTLIQDWQYYGRDNAYPSQYPATDSLGGEAGMRAAGSAARANSCLFGLYENYTDYYPNYPAYNPASTMANADGTQMQAWLNTATGIQSFAVKPNLFVANAQTQSPFIHRDYGTNASFVDVNSSAKPGWRTDEDPGAIGSGTLAAYRDDSIALWSYERTVEGGPVFGEGKYHWFWSGLLDGVEAQFGSESTPITNGALAPLFVDFDLTRIHPLQVNYGMGYYRRWMPGAATITSTLSLDAYRMQEVIFGHSPYLTDDLWSSVPRALLEQNLVSPVATRYALQTPDSVAYMVNGAWSDASGAAKAGDFSLAQVNYPNGDTIVANSRSSNLAWNSLLVPQYGWAAKGSHLLAYTALLGGHVADYAATSQAIYANARNQSDLLAEDTLATPEVAVFKQIGKNAIQLQLSWDVNKPQPTTDYQEFIHFVNSANSTSGVTGGEPSIRTTAWTSGEHIADNTLTFYLPAAMPNGTYQIRVGLFTGPQRATLYGNDDGTRRYTVGNVTVANNGSSVVFKAIPLSVPKPDSRLNSNGSVMDFGTIRTDGMVMLQQQQKNNSEYLELSSYPRFRDVVVQINSNTVAMPKSVICDNGDVVVPVLSAAPYWQIHMRGRKYCVWGGTLP